MPAAIVSRNGVARRTARAKRAQPPVYGKRRHRTGAISVAHSPRLRSGRSEEAGTAASRGGERFSPAPLHSGRASSRHMRNIRPALSPTTPGPNGRSEDRTGQAATFPPPPPLFLRNRSAKSKRCIEGAAPQRLARLSCPPPFLQSAVEAHAQHPPRIAFDHVRTERTGRGGTGRHASFPTRSSSATGCAKSKRCVEGRPRTALEGSITARPPPFLPSEVEADACHPPRMAPDYARTEWRARGGRRRRTT